MPKAGKAIRIKKKPTDEVKTDSKIILNTKPKDQIDSVEKESEERS